MGTQVQFNMYVPRYQEMIDDPNDNAAGNNKVLQHHQYNNTQQQWNGLFPTTRSSSSIDLKPFDSDKDRIRQIILKQETIFRHQLHELHRLYTIQRNLMNEAKSKEEPRLAPTSTSRSSLLSSSCIASEQDTNRWLNPSEPKFKIQRRLFDLERPADEYINGDSSKCNSFLKTGHALNGVTLKGEFQRLDLFANPHNTLEPLLGMVPKSTGTENGWRIFGVEIPDGGSSTITHWNNRLISNSTRSSASLTQSRKGICDLDLFDIGGMVKPKKNEESLIRWQNGNLAPFGFDCSMERESSYQMSTDSLQKKFQQFVQDSSSTTRDSLQKKIKAVDKNPSGFGGIGGYDRNLGDTSAASMKLGLNHEKCKAEDEASEPINLFDLQKTIKAGDKNRSDIGGIGGYDRNLVNTSAVSMKSGSTHDKHKAAEEEALEPRNLFNLQKNIKADDKNCSGIGGIGGYDHNLGDGSASPRSGSKLKAEEEASEPRNIFDLNVCLTEEEQEDASLITDLEKEIDISEEHSEEDKSAADTLITILRTGDGSRSGSLDWFAEIVSSLEIEIDSVDIESSDFAPNGMDYFEFVTLNLKESTYVPEPKGGDVSSGQPRKGPARRGRQRKDFQRDILPGLTSLSRNEVTEDLQTIERLMKAAKCRSKGPKARTKRQCAADSPPLPRSSKCPDEGTVTLMRWGKRARRPRRTRCSSAFQSVTLREVF